MRPQSLHTTLGVWLISWPTTVTVAQILPVRNGIITGAARFLDAPTDLKGVSSPVVRAAAAAGAASGAAVGACIVAGPSAVADVFGGEPNPACIHEYTVFSRVFSHGSNTRIIRVNTYSEYVFTT